jgi:hypothetical protein
MIRMAKQRLSIWRTVLVVLMLCLMVVQGCDVRPFSDFVGDEDGTDESDDTGNEDGDGATDSLGLTANPSTITVTAGGTEETTITINNFDSARLFPQSRPRAALALRGTDRQGPCRLQLMLAGRTVSS